MGATEREAYINLAATRWARKQRVGGVDRRGRVLNPTIGQRILLELAFSADASGTSLLGHAALADACRCGETVVLNWLQAFEKAGVLTRENRALRAGGRTSARISLDLQNYNYVDAPNHALRALDSSKNATIDATKTAQPNRAPQGLDKALGSAETRRPKRAGRGLEGSSQTAPGGSQTAPGAVFLIKINKNPLTPLSETEATLAIRDMLTEFGLSAETAETMMMALASQGIALTASEAERLIAELDQSDPEGSALAMIKELAGEDASGTLPPRRRARQTPAVIAQHQLAGFVAGDEPINVRPVDDRDLFDACVSLMLSERKASYGHKASWTAVAFPAAIVALARAHRQGAG